MADTCTHLDTIRDVTPSADGCEECLKMGAEWVHLRLCLTCGHVGCCDSSRYKHATKHFHAHQAPDRALARARRGLDVVLRRRGADRVAAGVMRNIRGARGE